MILCLTLLYLLICGKSDNNSYSFLFSIRKLLPSFIPSTIDAKMTTFLFTGKRI